MTARMSVSWGGETGLRPERLQVCGAQDKRGWRRVLNKVMWGVLDVLG